MNMPNTTTELPRQRVVLVPRTPRKARGDRLRRQEPKSMRTDPAYGCVDWFEYQAADATKGEEDADKRPDRR
jgi:hypothetical protein